MKARHCLKKMDATKIFPDSQWPTLPARSTVCIHRLYINEFMFNLKFLLVKLVQHRVVWQGPSCQEVGKRMGTIPIGQFTEAGLHS